MKFRSLPFAITFQFLISLPAAAQVDTLPNTQQSAEGVAVLMAQAFINADSKLWTSIQNPKLQRNKDLDDFVKDIANQMGEIRKLEFSARPGPSKIIEVRKMGTLSQTGPNSYAYTFFNFKQIGYVDVFVVDRTGLKTKNRTFVCWDADFKWYVLPRPDLVPLLTVGLNAEPMIEEVVWREESTS